MGQLKVYRIQAHYRWKGNLIDRVRDIEALNAQQALESYEDTYRERRLSGGFPRTCPPWKSVTIDKIEEIPWNKSKMAEEERYLKRHPADDEEGRIWI